MIQLRRHRHAQPTHTLHARAARRRAGGDGRHRRDGHDRDAGAELDIPDGGDTDGGTRSQWQPSLSASPDGHLLASWYDARNTTGNSYERWGRVSADNGATWSAAKKVNPGKPNDGIDHYNVTVAVGTDGRVHVAYRQRNEARNPPLFSPTIDTFYQESRNGGKTFSSPLKVDVKPSHAYYDAFSRDGSFEGDYNQTASAGGFTYIVREQGTPLYRGEPPALTKNPDGSDTVVLKNSGKGHQHQRNWVALVRDLAAGRGPCVGSSSLRTRIRHVHVTDGHLTIRGTARDLGCAGGIRRVEVAVAKHVGRHRCRFASSDGTFGPAVRCSHRHFVRARGTSSWSLALPGELRRGHYVLWARARGALRRGAAAHRTFAVR